MHRSGKIAARFYFDFANLFVYAVCPLVFFKNWHMNFKEMDEMLDAVAHCSLLPEPTKIMVIFYGDKILLKIFLFYGKIK